VAGAEELQGQVEEELKAAEDSPAPADARVPFPNAASDKYRRPLYAASPVTVLLFALIMVDWQVRSMLSAI
jgi:hypothetical protein